jgi:phenylacetate-coenzyme A ligase PaaK-like adenylate-forming protein
MIYSTITIFEAFRFSNNKKTVTSFQHKAIQLYKHQARHNPVFKSYLEALNKDPDQVSSLEQISFLPISFFKNQVIKTGNWKEEALFTSSGTTGLMTSRHAVRSMDAYLANSEACFRYFFGPIENTIFLCLLPSYMEREGSSLIYMAEYLVEKSGHPASGFYLYDYGLLHNHLQELRGSGHRIVLLGVSFALLDFAETYHLQIPELVVMETGGMKGRRKEILREEVHEILTKAFGVPSISSEYGMTELFSQAYSLGYGKFKCPPNMQILIRDVNDPFDYAPRRGYGGINIIDLANEDTCAFIETQDLGRIHSDGSFEVLGRFDNADIRGCNLMVY